MFFDSALFVWFLLIAWAVYWTLVRRPRFGVLWLLLCSYGFYACWNWKLLGLILFSTVLDYQVGRRLHAESRPTSRRALLFLSLAGNLGVLAVFKYADFVIESINAAGSLLGHDPDLALFRLVLPVGISFYTFQTLSYTIDIYRRRLQPVDDPLHFALFVVFFPQLVAGPIVRASEFLPQLVDRARYASPMMGRGPYLVALGLFKKVAVADYLAVNLVDRVFDAPQLYSSVEMLMAVYGYAVQIYCDFSGYSDVAIGAALMFGLQLPENFARPYAARNLQDFWRRWHISLSTWLRDYLYISLGGSRGTAMGTYRNLAVTMLLGGLWHGASWNFVIWGALHGLVLAGTRMAQRGRERRGVEPSTHPLARAGRVLVTFHFVCFCWVFFRAATLSDAISILSVLAEGTTFIPNLTPTLVFVVMGALAAHLSPRGIEQRAGELFARAPFYLQAALLVLVAVTLQHIKGADSVPFIYFQF